MEEVHSISVRQHSSTMSISINLVITQRLRHVLARVLVLALDIITSR